MRSNLIFSRPASPRVPPARRIAICRPVLRATFGFLLGWLAPASPIAAMTADACIPAPARQTAGPGSFVFGPRSCIGFRDETLAPLASLLREQFKFRAGLDLSPVVLRDEASGGQGILLSKVSETGGDDPTTPVEGYTLEVTPEGITIAASTEAGLFYGAQSLLQMAEVQFLARTGKVSLPALRIVDAPRFAWRGVMLDESRHFFGKKTVMELLDAMARLKLNRFHWHLTDETGWRIEIKKYPRLTTVGARGNWSDPEAPAAYYTQDEIREIVAYAAQRQIVIVPEIDMPGHATAACRAYPELSGGGAAPWAGFTFNPAREQTYRFLADVLTEIAALFPGPYLHIGGDEVHFGNQSWSSDPEIVAFTRAQGLGSAVELERYFIRRMAAVVRSLGKTTMGWDEIADAGVPPTESAVVWWRHDKPAVLRQLLQRGYPVVLAPRIPCYFDFVQHESHAHGRRWKGEFGDLDRVYGFPDAALTERPAGGDAGRILGLQACIWTERIQNPDRLWFMTFPRLAAFAEAAWTPAEQKSPARFHERLRAFLRGLEREGRPHFDPFLPARYPEPPAPVKTPAGTANG